MLPIFETLFDAEIFPTCPPTHEPRGSQKLIEMVVYPIEVRFRNVVLRLTLPRFAVPRFVVSDGFARGVYWSFVFSEVYAKFGQKPTRGALLWGSVFFFSDTTLENRESFTGPPGCGKTMLAKAIATGSRKTSRSNRKIFDSRMRR